mmetsp:Transcript_8083/g.23777  ORF Transcript_8083/g.23777 Transcript_8083/m.23777 type:complete len:317 (-) Transcript_8083:1426-2376(-)
MEARGAMSIFGQQPGGEGARGCSILGANLGVLQGLLGAAELGEAPEALAMWRGAARPEFPGLVKGDEKVKSPAGCEWLHPSAHRVELRHRLAKRKVREATGQVRGILRRYRNARYRRPSHADCDSLRCWFTPSGRRETFEIAVAIGITPVGSDTGAACATGIVPVCVAAFCAIAARLGISETVARLLSSVIGEAAALIGRSASSTLCAPGNPTQGGLLLIPLREVLQDTVEAPCVAGEVEFPRAHEGKLVQEAPVAVHGRAVLAHGARDDFAVPNGARGDPNFMRSNVHAVCGRDDIVSKGLALHIERQREARVAN